MALQLEFRHDCQNLGCANYQCNLCKLSQRRRCPSNFAAKYLAPCDVVEAKCGAQIYVVVTDANTGQLVQQGLEDLGLLISIVDGRKLEAEGSGEEGIECCELLANKQGQPLLAHGRSGSYTDSKRVMVPMIHGQALLPDLKITDSSEALLTGRAPPFRLAVRAVHRTGEQFHGITHALSDPFVVATARVKGAAKLEIPHVDDHVSKIDCVGLQTQKKLEDIRAAAVAAGVPDLNLPHNTVIKVGQFRDLVETAERNKALRETLKQVLRLTKGWDVARDHVRKAVETDMQLRVYHPDGRTEVGLVFKCGSFNVIDINRPVGLMRRKQNPQQSNQELVDVIWLPLDTASFPDAVKRMLPQASTDWRKDGHPGWALLPLTIGHMPPYSEGGKPSSQTSSFTFTIRMAPATAAPPPSTTPQPVAPPGGIPVSPRGAPGRNGMTPPPLSMGAGMNGMNNGGGGGGLPGFPGSTSGLPLGLNLGGGLGGLGMPQGSPQLPAGFVPGGNGGGLDALRLPPAGLPSMSGTLPPDLLFGSQQQMGAPPQLPQPQQMPQSPMQQQQQQQFGGIPGLGGLGGELPPGLAGLDAATVQGLMQMPTLDLYSAGSAPGSVLQRGAAAVQQAQAAAAAAAAAGQPQGQRGGGGLGGPPGGVLPPELAHLLKDDSMSPFEDPNFQQLMSMMAGPANGQGQSPAPAGSAAAAAAAAAAASAARGPAPGSARRDSKHAKRKADTSLETWMDMNKGLEDMAMPGGPGAVAPLESLFTSMLPGGEEGVGDDSSGPAPPRAAGFFPAPGSGKGAPPVKRSSSQSPGGTPPLADGGAAAAAGGQPTPMDVPQPSMSSQQQQASRGVQRSSAQGPPLQAQLSTGAAPMQAEGSAAAAAAAAGLAPAPAPLVTTITLEQMQQQFARAMRQEISFAELEVFLKQYNLLPSGQPANGGTGPQVAMAMAAAAGGMGPPPDMDRDGSRGLEDMQTIERALPA